MISKNPSIESGYWSSAVVRVQISCRSLWSIGCIRFVLYLDPIGSSVISEILQISVIENTGETFPATLPRDGVNHAQNHAAAGDRGYD